MHVVADPLQVLQFASHAEQAPELRKKPSKHIWQVVDDVNWQLMQLAMILEQLLQESKSEEGKYWVVLHPPVQVI